MATASCAWCREDCEGGASSSGWLLHDEAGDARVVQATAVMSKIRRVAEAITGIEVHVLDGRLMLKSCYSALLTKQDAAVARTNDGTSRSVHAREQIQ